MIKSCDELGSMEKEKWAFQQVLKHLSETHNLEPLYVLAEANDKMGQKYINFNLTAALKTGWLVKVESTKNQSK